MLDFEMKIKVQEKVLTSPHLHAILSPNFVYPIKNYLCYIGKEYVQFSAKELPSFIKSFKGEGEIYLFGENEYNKILVVEKQLRSWFIYPGSPMWFATYPVNNNWVKMVSEFNAIKHIENSFNKEMNPVINIWKEATDSCIEKDFMSLSHEHFINKQLQLLIHS